MSTVNEKAKQKMLGVLDRLKEDLKTIRTGRASPSAFENVMVEVYGSNARLRDVAQISAPDARQILITPFDPQTASSIQKSIDKANLNVKPVLDGTTIRISIAPMDGNARELMCKQCKKFSEESKIHVRQIRKDSNDALKKQKAEKIIGEDIVNSEEKKIQELTDDFCKKCDELAHQKEKEVMTI